MTMAKIEQASAREPLKLVPELFDLINSGSMSQAACVAAELRIPDLLATGPKDVAHLAQATASHAPSLHRLLRALASIGLCTECADGLFELSPLGSLLRTDASNSLRSWTLWWGRYQWPVWANLLYSVKTGESARKLVTGANDFGYLERDQKAAAVFNRAMAEFTTLVAGEVVRVYDFAGMRRIVDVGGGHGALLAAVLDMAHPDARGVLLDMPHAIEGARKLLTAAGLADRCDFTTEDFFKSIPTDADAYLLKAIVHDYDDARSKIILQNCRRAILPNGKLLIIERVLPSRFEASSRHNALARADLNMLVALGGRERTEAEFKNLFETSGFRLSRVVETGLEYSIIEGVPC
jgi:orsellinic acid C2-O-methyltransferase